MPTPPRLTLIFAGSGEFGLPTLKALLSTHDVIQVVSQPDRPAGRGRKLTPTPIAQFALDHNLPLIRTPKIADEQLPPADAMVVIAFGQKIPDPIVHHPRLGSINLHASRLPKYRGAAPINWAMLHGDPTTGNSVIRLAQKMDAGAILAQSEFPICPTETAGELHDRLSADGPALVLAVLEQLATNTATELPQDDSRATLAPKLSRETATLDWSRPAQELVNKINGLSPWPGCRVRILDADGTEISRATLVRAQLVSNETFSRWHPGEISLYGPITAGDGRAVDILDIQPEGKRPMPLAHFRNGHPWSPGMRLESLT
jgi:methionyl-tRNA formyltransferase